MLLDKPRGLTSHDVVARVRRVYHTRAVGHTGTLDPFATGLLVVLLGRATRLARYLSGLPKTYLATARLGQATTTDDLTGTPIEPPKDPGGVTDEQVRTVLAGLAGQRLQRPPPFSAKRIAGERSYQRARRGEAVELEPVAVTIHAIALVEYRNPDLTFRTTVSAGTYVRALGRDVGAVLGTGAHLTALRRESIGPLRVENAVALDRLAPETPLLSPLDVLRHLPAAELDATARARVAHGNAVRHPGLPEGAVALVSGQTLVAVAQTSGEWVKPEVVLE